MEKIYRVQMNSSGMPNFSTAVEIDTEISDYSDKLWRIAYERGNADRPQGEFTKREYEQFLHGISLSLLSKRSAQHWGYEEETAQKIRWLEALEQKVRAKMKGADDE